MSPAGRLLAVFVLAGPPAVAGVAEPERAVAQAAAERDRLAALRERLAGEARKAAEGLGALKTPGEGARAEGELARKLRAFDTLARRLDDAEAKLDAHDKRLQRARAAFAAAIEAEERRLEARARREGAAAVAADLSALAAARARVAEGAGGAFRPPLEVVVDPLDGAADVEAKIAILESEQERVAGRIQDLESEESLVAVRLAARREWARDLGAARRDARGTVDLIDRGYEDVQAQLQAIEARALALPRERAALKAALTQLAARRKEAEDRLADLRRGR